MPHSPSSGTGSLRYPQAVELHVGVGYAQLAREEYAWARQAFDTALALDAEHEDALAGLGETLLVLGQLEGALRAFQRLIDLGFADDHELMLQVGRALFREGFFVEARRFFELCREHHPASAEVAASLGYTAHRLGMDADAFYWLRRALELEPEYPEPRIYLANILYDRGEIPAALLHFARVKPDDHFDDLGVWRTIELLKAARNAGDTRSRDPALAGAPRRTRPRRRCRRHACWPRSRACSPTARRAIPNQLELFGTLMREVPGMQKRPAAHLRRPCHRDAERDDAARHLGRTGASTCRPSKAPGPTARCSSSCRSLPAAARPKPASGFLSATPKRSCAARPPPE